MTRSILAALAASTCLSLPAMAQDAPEAAPPEPAPAPVRAPDPGPLTWSELVTPDRLIHSVLQSGLLALRSVVEFRWEDMAVDARRGTISLTDLILYPPLGDGDCAITARGAQIQTSTFTMPQDLGFELRLAGVEATPECLPPPARMAMTPMGLERLTSPLVRISLDYDLPTGAADVSLSATVDGAAAINAEAAFDYAWVMKFPEDEEPVPVLDLARARIEVDNLGLWTFLSQVLPEPFTNPETGGIAVTGMLTSMFSQPGEEAEVEAFAADVGSGWSAFLADPRTIVVETQIDGAVMLDLEAYTTSPVPLIRDLQPRIGVRSSSIVSAISPAKLAAARDETSDMSTGERMAIVRALANGTGVPRAPDLAAEIIGPMALESPEAALLAAEILADDQPDSAYFLALRAGAAALPAAGLLDRLESELDLSTILQAQGRTVAAPPEVPDSLAQIRELAMTYLSGEGTARNFAFASFYATLGAAFGDSTSRDILSGLDSRFEGDPAWANLKAEVAEYTMAMWMEQDLPAKLQGAQ